MYFEDIDYSRNYLGDTYFPILSHDRFREGLVILKHTVHNVHVAPSIY